MNFLFKSLAGLCLMAALVSFASLAQAQTPTPEELSATRIVGGYEAIEGAWPWMAALSTTGYSPATSLFCGGSLIHPNWVVTASHCTEGKVASSITVWMGLHDKTDTTDARSYAVKQIIMHPSFHMIENSFPDQDIALLELEDGANEYETIPLVAQGDPQNLTEPDTTATVTGWGRISYGGSRPNELRQVQVDIMTQQEAIDGYGVGNVTDVMLPAGYPEGARDACTGDSGGPLMVPDANGQDWVLAGLVSWGIGCAEPGAPGMYTRVSQFTDWVSQYVPTFKTNSIYEAYIPYISYSAEGYTGVALSNMDNDSANAIEISYYDNDGTVIASQTDTIAAHGEKSFGVENSETSSAGWALVQSQLPLRGLAMIAGPNYLPMFDVDMQDSANPDLAAAHLDLTEGRWESTFMACNPSDSEVTLSFTLYDSNGSQVLLPAPTRTIPAMGSAQIILNELFPDHSSTGSLQVSSTGEGVAAFLLYDGSQIDSIWRAGLSVQPE